MTEPQRSAFRASDRRQGVPAVIARFPAPPQARAAMLRLESSGVDGDAIALLGPSADAAREDLELQVPDRRLFLFLSQRLVFGVVVGAVVGAVLGAAVGAIAIAFDNSNVAPVITVTAVAGALLGCMVGALVAIERSTGSSDSYALTFEDAPPGPLWLGVYSADPRVEATIRETSPLEVRRPHDLRELREVLGPPG